MISRRAYSQVCRAHEWEEIWEAGPYYARLAERLESAREYAIFVGWQLDSRLPLPRAGAATADAALAGQETLKAKIVRLCEERPGFHVYFLIWDHAAVYIPERQKWQSRAWKDVHPRVHFIFDNRHPIGGSHHEKICIIDGETAFCGGIDLCDERWDSPAHRFEDERRSLDGCQEHHGPYHDLAVRVGGPICAALHGHVEERWRAISPVPFPPARECSDDGRGANVYLSRTWIPVEERVGRPPARPTREIEFLFGDLIRSARRSIVIEGQYFWSRRILDLMIAKLKETRGTGFRLTVVLADLSATSSMTWRMERYELRLLRELERAASFYGARLVIGSPYVLPPPGDRRKARAVYIHSKLLIVDDRWLSIGSANLAARAFRLDTEVNLTYEARTESEREHVRSVARYVEQHWNLAPAEAGAAHVNPSLHLRRFHARPAVASARWLETLFDPVMPWFQPFRRELVRRAARRPWTRDFAFALAVTWGTAVALTSAEAWPLLPGRAWLLAAVALLCGAWIWKAPVAAIAIALAWALGPRPAAGLVGASVAISAGLAYAFGRVFPASAAAFYGPVELHAAGAPGRDRSFLALVRTLLRPDPRVTFRARIAFQGIDFVPMGWFAAANWIILPTWAYALTAFAALLAALAGSRATPGWAPEAFIWATTVIVILSARRLPRWSPGRSPDWRGGHALRSLD